jgi:hypothetical protein
MTDSTISTTLTATIKRLAAQIKTIGIVAGAVTAVLAIISFFTAHPLATFLKLISFAGVVLMLFSVAVMILTFKKAREVAPPAMLASLAAALIGTFVSLAFARNMPSSALVLFALLAGGALGALWSRTTLLFVDQGRVRMRGTIWYLAVWALTLAVNQSISIMTGRAPVAVACLALAGAGLAIGNTAGLLFRTNKAAAPLHRAKNKSHA